MKIKYILFILIFILLTPLAILQGVSVLFPCDQRVTSPIRTSNYKYEAKKVEMTCHATTPYITSVVISKPIFGRSIPYINERGVFGFNGKLEDINIQWIDNRTLKIMYKDCGEIYGQDNKWKGLTIIYENQCKENFSK